MDHVNIISQEALTMMAPWVTNIISIVGFSMIAFLIGMLLYSIKDHKKISNDTVLKIILYVGSVGLCVLLILFCTLGFIFRVPSGRYKYEATIDKEHMTVSEYEKFMEDYNHLQYKNGVYYFEDWPNKIQYKEPT